MFLFSYFVLSSIFLYTCLTAKITTDINNFQEIQQGEGEII